MLSDRMLDKLNEQINVEFYSSNLYLQMSSWCESQGLEGCATFLQAHAAEEMEHMQRLFTYVNECGALAKIGAIEAPPTDFESIDQVFETTLEHERFVTRKINELADVAFQQKDYSTFNFLQWYVAEQHEEEKLFNTIVDKIRIIGTEGRGLYHFDEQMRQMGARSAAAAPAGE
jgi:ferritin